jgi:peroxin-11B
MRIGKNIEHFKAAAVAADSKTLDPVLKYLAVGRQLGYAVYLTLDSLTYLDNVGIRKFEGAARLQREAYRAWLAGLLCNVVAGVYTLYNLRTAAKKQVDSQDAEKAVELKKLEKCAYLQIIDYGVDMLTTKQRATSHAATAHLRPLRCHSA